MAGIKEEPFMKLAVFLKRARAEAGLSQSDVARHFGYSTPQFISNWERGLSTPPIEILRSLAQLYKVSDEELFDILQQVTVDQVAYNLKRKFLATKSKSS